MDASWVQTGLTVVGGIFVGACALVAVTRYIISAREEDREKIMLTVNQELAEIRKSLADKHTENAAATADLRREVHSLPEKMDARYVPVGSFNMHIAETNRRLSSLEAQNAKILDGVLDLLGSSGGKESHRAR